MGTADTQPSSRQAVSIKSADAHSNKTRVDENCSSIPDKTLVHATNNASSLPVWQVFREVVQSRGVRQQARTLGTQQRHLRLRDGEAPVSGGWANEAATAAAKHAVARNFNEQSKRRATCS